MNLDLESEVLRLRADPEKAVATLNALKTDHRWPVVVALLDERLRAAQVDAARKVTSASSHHLAHAAGRLHELTALRDHLAT